MAWPASVSGRQRRWHFLLRVTYHGADYHFSTSAVSPSSSSGSIAHTPTLSVSGYSETFQYLSQSIDRQSVPVSVGWPYDIAEAVAAGFRLDTAQAELSVWIEGTAYESRRVLIVGNVQQPSYGAPGEPVTFSIEAAPWIDRGTWPDLLTSPTEYDLTITSQPHGALSVGGREGVLDDLRGTVAPMVIGNPGNLNQTRRANPTGGSVYATQAADVWERTRPGAFTEVKYGSIFENNGVTRFGNPAGAFPAALILCGHATQAGAYGGDGTQILRASSGTEDAPVAVLFNQDGQYVTGLVPFHKVIGGRTCTVVNLYDYFNTRAEVRYNDSSAPITTGSGSISPASSTNSTSNDPNRALGDRVGFSFVSMHDDFDTFYGLTNGEQDGPLRTVQELLNLTLSSSSLPVDWPRLYSALDRLPIFDVEGYIDERVSVWDFVSRELLPLLPMSLRTGPRGLYAITADLGATAADAIGTLRAGLDCWRVGVIQYERRLSDLTGTIEVQCGDYAGKAIRTVTADGTTMLQGQRARLAQESSVVGQLLSRVQSADVAAGQTTTTIKAPWLAGETGGQYVAHQRLAYQAAQIRTVRYRLAPEFLELEVGDLVRLVDPEVYIDGPAYLSTLEIDTSAIVGTFSLYEPVSR
jgi:hypothetical protein